jgi:hypothetical protein
MLISHDEIAKEWYATESEAFDYGDLYVKADIHKEISVEAYNLLDNIITEM